MLIISHTRHQGETRGTGTTSLKSAKWRAGTLHSKWRQHLSAHRDEQPASAQNAEVPGPSGQRMESSCGIQSHKVAAQHGPQELPAGTNLLLLGHRHRIKQTQFDKMKKTNRELADLLLQASRSISSQAL